MYPVFGIRGASWFLGVSEWLIAALLFWGFWNNKAGILGAVGSIGTFITTVTIIPFMPDGWAASAGGFPAMTGNVPFLMKDVVLLAVSVYLLKHDVARASLPEAERREWRNLGGPRAEAAGEVAAKWAWHLRGGCVYVHTHHHRHRGGDVPYSRTTHKGKEHGHDASSSSIG